LDNDEGNTFATRIPAYSLLDATLEFRRSSWTFGLAVNNLTNRKYYDYAVASTTVPGKYNAYPLPERTFLFSASYRFEK
jgi:iron complex outermembrane receptor protein